MFLTGALIMVYNLIKTVYSPATEREPALPADVAVAGE
jgi:cbb3-type cytochrome oxidase subunit 1